jgi:tocopherol cyclase
LCIFLLFLTKRTMLRIFKPEVFQGSLNRKAYFEGWYFKHVSKDLKQVYAFIPGISINGKDKHAFIQIINGITGKTNYISYPIDSFKWTKDKFSVQIGQSSFSEYGIDLNIDDPAISIQGKLSYSGNIPYPQKMLAPGIMGWYSFVPFMECYHGVVSVDHAIQGILSIDDQSINFSDGNGYIEKDWGRSFPECWVWLQTNSFSDQRSSLFVSVAKIPWLGRFFIGFIAFLYVNDRFYTFSTYNSSKLEVLKRDGNQIEIQLTGPQGTLKVLTIISNAGDLVAPVMGNMNRMIKESIDSKVTYELIDKNNKGIAKGKSDRAGLEVIEKIFEYF